MIKECCVYILKEKAINSFNKTLLKLQDADANLEIRNNRIFHEGLAQIELMEDIGLIDENESNILFRKLTNIFNGR